jgi:mannose-1-phosphate guanylyltransferase
MIQVTVDRLKGLVSPEHILIVTGRDMYEVLRESVPELPPENFILEPSARNSGPAAGLGTYCIAERDPNAVIAVLSADHHIANEYAFRESMRAAAHFAERGQIVTIGITPTYPSTGFGYIQRGAKIGDAYGLKAYRSEGFREKPDNATAEAFVKSGLYSWNAGMFIWQAATIRKEFVRQQPEMHAALTQLASDPQGANATELWSRCPKLSIDYAIMENAEQVAVIPIDMGWSDVGTWASLFDLLHKDANGSAIRSEVDGHIQIDSRNNLIVGDKLVVTIGVEDLVIVETPDAVLVCRRDRAQDVKLVVDQLKQSGLEQLM